VRYPLSVTSEEIRKRVAQINRENRSKEEQKAIKTLENKLLPKLEEYERHLDTRQYPPVSRNLYLLLP
jgi:hypothetical protein